MNFFEGTGKMKLAWIAHGVAYISDGQLRQLQKFRGLGHAVINQKFLGAFAKGIPEYLSEIASVQTAESCDIFHRDIILKILFNIRDGLLNVKIAHPAALKQSSAGGGAGQIIQKKVQGSYEMKGDWSECWAM